MKPFCNLILSLFVFSVASSWAQTAQAAVAEYPTSSQKILAQYNDAFLEEVNGLPVLHLRGNDYDMGYQYGVLAGDRVAKTIKILDDIVSKKADYKMLTSKLFPVLRRLIGSVFWLWCDKSTKEEFKGLVAGAKKSGYKINKNDLVFLNSVIDIGGMIRPFASMVDFDPDKQVEARKQFLDIFGLGWFPMTNCDSMAVWGSRTVGGKTFQTRNVDINTGMGFEYVPLVIVYKPTNGVPYVTAAFAGITGIFTGMNAYGVGLGQIWAFSKKVGLATPWPLQLKKVFSKAKSATDAVEIFRDMKRYTYGSNFVFADAFGVGRAVEVNKNRFESFTDNDPKEDLARVNGELYSIPLAEAVLRGDAAMSVKIRAEQTASNGPDGDPRTASAYKNRYKGQGDRIIAYEQAGVLMGHLEAEAISRETAMKNHSLQNAVYANSDRMMWVTYAWPQPDGSILPAYLGEYRQVPFRDYLASLNIDDSGLVTVSGDQWVAQTARMTSDFEVLVTRNENLMVYSANLELQKGDVVELRLKQTGYIVDRVEY